MTDNNIATLEDHLRRLIDEGKTRKDAEVQSLIRVWGAPKIMGYAEKYLREKGTLKAGQTLDQKPKDPTGGTHPASERTRGQIIGLYARAKARGWNRAQIHSYMLNAFNVKTSKSLTPEQYRSLMTTVGSASYDKAIARLGLVSGPDKHQKRDQQCKK